MPAFISNGDKNYSKKYINKNNNNKLQKIILNTSKSKYY